MSSHLTRSSHCAFIWQTQNHSPLLCSIFIHYLTFYIFVTVNVTWGGNVFFTLQLLLVLLLLPLWIKWISVASFILLSLFFFFFLLVSFSASNIAAAAVISFFTQIYISSRVTAMCTAPAAESAVNLFSPQIHLKLIQSSNSWFTHLHLYQMRHQIVQEEEKKVLLEWKRRRGWRRGKTDAFSLLVEYGCKVNHSTWVTDWAVRESMSQLVLSSFFSLLVKIVKCNVIERGGERKKVKIIFFLPGQADFYLNRLCQVNW